MSNKEQYHYDQQAASEAREESIPRAPGEYEAKYIASPATPLSLLEQFESSAEGIAKFSQLVINEVEEGRENALRVKLFMKTLEKIIERVDGRLAANYLREAETHGQKTFEYKGAQVSISELGTKYDYTNCNCPVWNGLTAIINKATEDRKIREALLKVLKSPFHEIIEGEGVTINPPGKKSTTGLSISIK